MNIPRNGSSYLIGVLRFLARHEVGCELSAIEVRDLLDIIGNPAAPEIVDASIDEYVEVGKLRLHNKLLWNTELDVSTLEPGIEYRLYIRIVI